MRIAIGSDHGGYTLKEQIKTFIVEELGYEVIDVGCETCAKGVSVDYPDYAFSVTDFVKDGTAERGIAICGTGIGMSIAANKVPGIRAALVNDLYSARMSRAHNDANVLALGGRVVGPQIALEIVKIFLTTPYEGGRHDQRLKKIAEREHV
ncbi:MAG: ribose 5-phosphate isomerase B [Candidatus Carbobacillus sp.]|nr:ribose 5-phosphate isomerase B [Candidatus Carbobacillus sp.]